MDKTGTYEFIAEPFHCDFSGRMFLGQLGNQMLNAADFHSTDRGFGMKYLMTINRSWVLSRLAIEMTEMPGQHEHRLKRFEIAYVAEAHQGDRLSFYREQTAEMEYCVRLVKTEQSTGLEVEVCRCKAVFEI